MWEVHHKLRDLDLLDSWTLTMGQIGRPPEMSVRSYCYSLRYNPGERSSLNVTNCLIRTMLQTRSTSQTCGSHSCVTEDSSLLGRYAVSLNEFRRIIVHTSSGSLKKEARRSFETPVTTRSTTSHLRISTSSRVTSFSITSVEQMEKLN